MKLKKRTLSKLFFAALILPAMACGSDNGDTDTGEPTPTGGVDTGDNPPSTEATWFDQEFRCETERSITWADVNDWHYQLQYNDPGELDADYKAIAATKFDLIVMDSEPPPRLPGLPAPTPNKNITERLKCGGDGEKLLVSYLAIGQAESYRYFYEDDWGPGNPEWIFAEDEFWPGDFYVRYWDPEWKAILMGSPDSRVDRIVAAGFDGIYLDTVDAYTFFPDPEPDMFGNIRHLESAARMRDLVKEVSAYAREISGNPDFGVFVQNAEELVSPWYGVPDWLEPLTGIGKEEPFFYATDVKVDDPDTIMYNDMFLGEFLAAGKIVMNVDYVTTPENIAEAYTSAREKGYIPLALGDKDLATIEIHPGHEPD